MYMLKSSDSERSLTEKSNNSKINSEPIKINNEPMNKDFLFFSKQIPKADYMKKSGTVMDLCKNQNISSPKSSSNLEEKLNSMVVKKR